jgi:deazaflavin-dependent oxidoreductase (nitroreductase family)
MLVALTGGTGFVGSHPVVCLLDHGHRPRLLVRDLDRAARVLDSRGVDPTAVELVEGDMVDSAAVGRLLDGADAVIHAAAAIGVTGTHSDLVDNLRGVEHVVGLAVERGLDPVIHVSSVAVFVPPDGPMITAESRLASPRTEYGQSKLDAERYVRRLQDGGAPVTIVYPGGLLGSDQPSHNAMMEGLAGALRTLWPVPTGGVSVLHVDDLAEALARMVDPGRGPRRLVLGGDFLRWAELADLCDELTGVPCRRLAFPGWTVLGLGSLLDLVRRVRPLDYPLTRDAAEIMVSMVPTDDAPTLQALGLRRRPVAATVEEALRSLAADGHLEPSRAGRLAPPGAAVPEPVGAAERARTWIRHNLVPRLTRTRTFTRVGPRIVPPLDRLTNRLSGGRFNVSDVTAPTLLLTTTGARSGEPRVVPLACVPEPGGSWLVVGSNFGRERHPAWTANLLHTPVAEVRFRGRVQPVTATELEGAARDAAWQALMRLLPVFDGYERVSGRHLRVFRLTPRQ